MKQRLGEPAFCSVHKSRYEAFLRVGTDTESQFGHLASVRRLEIDIDFLMMSWVRLGFLFPEPLVE